ncbi:hypothetical protein [Vibrio rotiferianus]|uniref:hypothetical protein n=1 Tax=Vibrio rotiferianus TaxID=190895 RepID=UPI003909341A
MGKSKLDVKYEKPIFRLSAFLYSVIKLRTVVILICLLVAHHILYGISISKSGAFIGALGLLLSLKHGFIKRSSNQDQAVRESQNMGGLMYWEGTCEDEEIQREAQKQTLDEMLGIFLVIIGGLISSYGNSFHLWINSIHMQKETVFQLIGLVSLALSFLLIAFSNPEIRLIDEKVDISPIAYKEKNLSNLISEYAKQKANKLLSVYLAVVGLIILVLEPFV